MTAVRQKKRAIVDSIKGQFGFLDYEVEEGKKLFFHMSEVQGSSYSLYPGDSVEFSIISNQVNIILSRWINREFNDICSFSALVKHQLAVSLKFKTHRHVPIV